MTSMFDFTHAGYSCVVIQPCPSGHPSWIVKIDHFCLIFHKITIKKEERAPSRGWPGHIHTYTTLRWKSTFRYTGCLLLLFLLFIQTNLVWTRFLLARWLELRSSRFWGSKKKKRLQLRSLHLRCVSRNVRRRRRPRCWPGTVHY